MDLTIRFLGATGTVTGSQYLLEANGTRVLIDCGIYQGRDLVERNWRPFALTPAKVDAAILTHAHLDHCGLFPKLVKEGFKGPIYATSASSEIAKIVMLDSAHMQEEDAKFKAKRHAKEGRSGPHPVQPLYTTEDAEAVLPLFRGVPYRERVKIIEGIEAVFFDAGHILGSAMVQVIVTQQGERRTLLFSGDIGRKNQAILRDPATFEHADYVVMESTYGDRVHPDEDDIETLLADAVNTTVRKGGNLVIPSFAVERSQEILYHLNNLQREKRIPHTMVFLDSPMAVAVTTVFRDHAEMFDSETRKLTLANHSPFDMSGLKLVRTRESSKSINSIRGSAIIIAGSGMCTGGRIKHHLAQNIHRPESTILFVGYQAAGTLGRRILDSTPADNVRIFGRIFPVRADVRRIHGFSGHADRDEMVEWVSHLVDSPKKVFITHGEPDVASCFRTYLAEKTGWHVIAPEWQQAVTLE